VGNELFCPGRRDERREILESGDVLGKRKEKRKGGSDFEQGKVSLTSSTKSRRFGDRNTCGRKEEGSPDGPCRMGRKRLER